MSHKSVKRFRKIAEWICDKKGCKFYGKPAQQGVCHTTDTFHGSADWRYVDRAYDEARRGLREVRRINKGKSRAEYVRYLECMYETLTMNDSFQLDELIRLRRKVALMEARKP